MNWFVYLIECDGGRIYTGITNNVEKRYAAHVEGRGARFTRSFRPQRLLAFFQHENHSSAAQAERQIKKLSSLEKRALCTSATNTYKKN